MLFCFFHFDFALSFFPSNFPFEILLPAVREEGPNGSLGGGAILLVIKGTAHHTFTDVVPYFQIRFSWLIRMVSCAINYMLYQQHGTDGLVTHATSAAQRILHFKVWLHFADSYRFRALQDMAKHRRPSFWLCLLCLLPVVQ